MTQTLEMNKKKFDVDGYAIYQNVLDKQLMGDAKEHIDWLIKKHPNTRPEAFGHQLVADDPFWVRLVSDSRLLDIAEQYIGPNIALFASHYISKPAFDGRPVLWHQDGSYWPLSPMNVVTLWLAVDDSFSENGCMRVVPGTQTLSLQEMRANLQTPNVLDSEVDPALVDEDKAVDLILKSGDVSVHHPNIIHGSNANLSSHRRCGLTIRYIPTSTLITKPGAGCPFLLRGEAVQGINEYLTPPKFDASRHMNFHDSKDWT